MKSNKKVKKRERSNLPRNEYIWQVYLESPEKSSKTSSDTGNCGSFTLTEKLLLFGGAIQDAGAVKARADQRKATSDWMEIEKARGISVTSTVLSFEYKQDTTQFHLNLQKEVLMALLFLLRQT